MKMQNLRSNLSRRIVYIFKIVINKKFYNKWKLTPTGKGSLLKF